VSMEGVGTLNRLAKGRLGTVVTTGIFNLIILNPIILNTGSDFLDSIPTPHHILYC
jgi:hypothetical protein